MLNVKDFYDPVTGSFSYLLEDSQSRECVVIDPVLNFDIISGRISTSTIEPVIDYIGANKLKLQWILETHAHADHLTAAQQLKTACGGNIAIGVGIVEIQKSFKEIYGFSDDFDTSGMSFDRLLQEGDEVRFGEYSIEVLATPGHTKDSLTYRLENYLFIGDTLFHPSLGSARCDFPGGDAKLLFKSIQRILSHNNDTVLCLCHDYPDSKRKAETFISIDDMKSNIHVQAANNKTDDFVTIREQRDSGLALPKLIIPSIQVNIQAGIKLTEEIPPLLWPINRF